MYKNKTHDYLQTMNTNEVEYKKMQEQMLVDMRLKNSIGTQTATIPKPTYKELVKHPFLARITAQLEKNDHDGYCSSDECEYTKKTVKANIVVPDAYVCHPVGKIEDTDGYKWANHLPVPEVNVQGSGYCRFHKPRGGVGQHQYRYTIKKVEIVENKKYDKDKDDYRPPMKTITAGQMIQALSKLPPDARLVITEEGFYSQSEFSEVMLPEVYTVGDNNKTYEKIRGLPPGTKVFRIGHSDQRY